MLTPLQAKEKLDFHNVHYITVNRVRYARDLESGDGAPCIEVDGQTTMVCSGDPGEPVTADSYWVEAER